MNPPERKMTPMMRQYTAAKADNPDCLLFFRMGDFYELFGEDAATAARELGIALTSREKGPDAMPMAGVPHHAVESYLAKLMQKGFRAAICDQIQDASEAQGVVDRAVVRVVTPGMVADDTMAQADAFHYTAALVHEGDRAGLAALDLLSGRFAAGQFDGMDALAAAVAALQPRELLVVDGEGKVPWLTRLHEAQPTLCVTPRSPAEFAPPDGAPMPHLLGAANTPLARRAVYALIRYAEHTQKNRRAWPQNVEPLGAHACLVLDSTAVAHLELVASLRDGRREGSLVALMDRTCTKMGSRLLRAWLLQPLLDRDAIAARHDVVGAFVADPICREAVKGELRHVADLDRLAGKAVMQTATPKDLAAVGRTLARVPAIRAALGASAQAALSGLAGNLTYPEELAALLNRALHDPAPARVSDGNVVAPGYLPELDELRELAQGGMNLIARIETRERERTGIQSLKVRYNKIFGYYIEITRANLGAVPKDYERKQTLVNGERYVTPELKELEERVLTAQEKAQGLEEQIFKDLRGQVAAARETLGTCAAALATLDVLQGLADLAETQRYVRPELLEDPVTRIGDGRHPVVEHQLRTERFVPNDVAIGAAGGEEPRLLLITGPNMAGKSTIMRQTALIHIMAQAGSFVPARAPVLGLVDRVFTRVGASDDLAKGQSTFMVEMMETASILRYATRRSLVILDEIGRGTSTFDGLAIAWAVAEHLHDQAGCRTLFATHYHELTELARTRAGVRNFHVAVKEWNDGIVFLHKLVAGGTNRSYGIQVGRLAGLPDAVVARAKEILRNLEEGELTELGAPMAAAGPLPEPEIPERGQLSLFHVVHRPAPFEQELRALDLDTLTPLEAVNLLHRWKAMKAGGR